MNKLTKYQAFESMTVSRTQITNAPYNPRKISPWAKKKLKEVIEKRGLIEPIVVNRRTWHIVGGHQRLAVLDALEGNHQYSLTIALVDLDEQAEKEMNIFLNNPDVQGEWDVIALQHILKDVDILNLGFKSDTLESLLSEVDVNLAKETSRIMSEKEQQKIADDVSALLNTAKDMDDTYATWHLIVTFGSQIDYEEFKRTLGIEKRKSQEITFELLKTFLTIPESVVSKSEAKRLKIQKGEKE